MGVIKIEVDIPEFKRELSIEVILRKDGEVSYQTKSDQGLEDMDHQYPPLVEQKRTSQQVARKNETTPDTAALTAGGNMMNLDF